MRLLRVIIVLLILVVGGLTGYAYLGDMGAAPKEMRVPVELDLGAAPQPQAPPATPMQDGTMQEDAASSPADQAGEQMDAGDLD